MGDEMAAVICNRSGVGGGSDSSYLNKPPVNYTCHRCGSQDHFIQHCTATPDAARSQKPPVRSILDPNSFKFSSAKISHYFRHQKAFQLFLRNLP